MQIQKCHHGVDTTILWFGETTGMSWEKWCDILVRMVDTLCESELYDVPNTNYRYDPAVFVTRGILCLYQKNSFTIFSDIPNQIIIKFQDLRPRNAEVLVQSLSEEWIGIDG